MWVESEGGTAAWVTETLVVPSVQGYRLPQPKGLWPYQSFSQPLVAREATLWLVFVALPIQALKGVLLYCSIRQAHRGAPLTEVLLCSLAHQSLKGASWVGCYSVVQ